MKNLFVLYKEYMVGHWYVPVGIIVVFIAGTWVYRKYFAE